MKNFWTSIFSFTIIVSQAIGDDLQIIPHQNTSSPRKKLNQNLNPKTRNNRNDIRTFIFRQEGEQVHPLDELYYSNVNTTFRQTSPTNISTVNCSTDQIYGPVEIVNATRFMELLVSTPIQNRTRNTKDDKIVPCPCILVMFYARSCIFSSQAAPHFNALSRFYPHIRTIAIDAIRYQNFNTQYGIVGVPTLMLIHNSKPIAKFNDTTYNVENFSRFIQQLTNLKFNESLYVISADFIGPLSSIPTNETDYCLVLSWIFIAICILYFTTQSRWWKQFIELVQNTWRESNAQHEHAD